MIHHKTQHTLERSVLLVVFDETAKSAAPKQWKLKKRKQIKHGVIKQSSYRSETTHPRLDCNITQGLGIQALSRTNRGSSTTTTTNWPRKNGNHLIHPPHFRTPSSADSKILAWRSAGSCEYMGSSSSGGILPLSKEPSRSASTCVSI